MWFKQLHLYQIIGTEHLPLDTLKDALATQAFRPVTKYEARRVGWAPPAGRGSDALVHEIQGHRLITMCRQDRLLPNSVITEVLEERAAERESETGYAPGRKERLLLKEQIVEELLPQAFTHTRRIDIWIDTTRQRLGVACASRKRAEEALDLLRETLGSLKVVPCAVTRPISQTMTGWLKESASRPEWLLLGDCATLRASLGDESTMRLKDTDLDSEEIQLSLATGRQASMLALMIEDQMSFVLNEDLTIKSIRFADALIDEAQVTEDDGDPVLRLETDFALMAHMLGRSLDEVINALGGLAEPEVEAEAPMRAEVESANITTESAAA